MKASCLQSKYQSGNYKTDLIVSLIWGVTGSIQCVASRITHLFSGQIYLLFYTTSFRFKEFSMQSRMNGNLGQLQEHCQYNVPVSQVMGHAPLFLRVS